MLLSQKVSAATIQAGSIHRWGVSSSKPSKGIAAVSIHSRGNKSPPFIPVNGGLIFPRQLREVLFREVTVLSCMELAAAVPSVFYEEETFAHDGNCVIKSQFRDWGEIHVEDFQPHSLTLIYQAGGDTVRPRAVPWASRNPMWRFWKDTGSVFVLRINGCCSYNLINLVIKQQLLCSAETYEIEIRSSIF